MVNKMQISLLITNNFCANLNETLEGVRMVSYDSVEIQSIRRNITLNDRSKGWKELLSSIGVNKAVSIDVLLNRLIHS